jgi:phospholipid/cholesterol/gamma-HCH transport system substrate-binding protein
MNPSRQLALGALIVGTLTLLAYFTLFLTESSLFGDKEQITITFDQARGLRAGDSVLVAGVRWGRVASVEYDSNAHIDQRITVIATLTQPVQLREDGWFRIEDSTLLGGRVLSINPGTPGVATLPDGASHRGEVIISPLDAMGNLLTESGDDFKEALSGLGKLTTLATKGEGLISDLLSSKALADDFAGTVASARGTLENVEAITSNALEGKGTLGRLLVAEDLYNSITRSAADLEASLANVRKTTDGIEAGEGTLGALLKDEALAADMREIVASIEDVSAGLKAGEGSLGKLLKDDTVFENVRKISEDLAVMTEKMRAGEGTLGRIVMEEDLYVEVERALGLITRTLEEYREAAPVTTMTSVLFSAF